MSTRSQNVKVTLRLPKDVYERAEQAAVAEQPQLGELLSGLVAEGLEARAAVRELLERYNAPGKLDRGISYKAVSEARRKTRSWRHSGTTTVPSSKPR
jgi:hypothetical protein